MEDMAYCMNALCKRWFKCLRGGAQKREPGVFTIANFYKVCNEVDGYKYFISDKEKVDEK